MLMFIPPVTLPKLESLPRQPGFVSMFPVPWPAETSFSPVPFGTHLSRPSNSLHHLLTLQWNSSLSGVFQPQIELRQLQLLCQRTTSLGMMSSELVNQNLNHLTLQDSSTKLKLVIAIWLVFFNLLVFFFFKIFPIFFFWSWTGDFDVTQYPQTEILFFFKKMFCAGKTMWVRSLCCRGPSRWLCTWWVSSLFCYFACGSDKFNC